MNSADNKQVVELTKGEGKIIMDINNLSRMVTERESEQILDMINRNVTEETVNGVNYTIVSHRAGKFLSVTKVLFG